MNKTMLLGAAVLMLAGCSPHPYVANHFGEAVKSSRQAQADMVWAADPATESTVEGQVSNAAMDRYHNSYGKPDTSGNALKIGVGTK